MKCSPLARIALALAVCLSSAACVKRAPTQAAPEPPAAREQAWELPPQATESRALDLLRQSSRRLASATSMAFTATVSHEFPSDYGVPLEFFIRYDVALKRPDKLKVVIPGDGPASEFYYDGKQMTAFMPSEGLVAVASAPATMDEALKMAFQAADIYFPFSDLILSDPYAALAEGVKLAFVVGESEVVGGIKTDVVAWASDDMFLQIWIGREDKLPRRYRAVFLNDPMMLRHEIVLTGWRLDGVKASGLTPPRVPASARRIEFAKPSAWPSPDKGLGAGEAGKPSPSGDSKTN